MKIFQIGFNKCGTSTLRHFLHKNGIASVHWDEGRLAQRIFDNLAANKELLSGYEEFRAFGDMEFIDGSRFLEGYRLFRQFAAQYPDSVFILNTRDREQWIQSRFRHNDGSYAAMHKSFYGVGSDEELAAIWRQEWERHHRGVLDFFRPGEFRFFTWRIDDDLPRLLEEHVPELSIDRIYYRARKVSTAHKSLIWRAKTTGQQIVMLQRRAFSALKQLSNGLFR